MQYKVLISHFCYGGDVVNPDRIETEDIRNELHMHVLQLYRNRDRPVLGPTQSPIQWVPRYIYRSKTARA